MRRRSVLLSLVCAIVAPFAASAACPNFALTSNNGTGHLPYAIVTADFNRDGILDVATVNFGGSISVELGNGNGTFATPTTIALPAPNPHPYGIAAADLDGDGILDLLVTETDRNRIHFYHGLGNGTFSDAGFVGTPSGPSSIVVGDFNHDGKMDFATTNYLGGNGNVSVFLGNGTFTFATRTDYAAGVIPFSIAAGDFNSDGNVDLAVANDGSDNFSVLMGNGDGTFAAHTDYALGASGAQFILVADFDGDGKPDVAVSNVFSNNVSILHGNGNGTFGAATNYATGSRPLGTAAGDFNGDGKVDLVVANSSSNFVTVLLGNGNGTFAAPSNFGNLAYFSPYGVAAGDFDRDGRTDLAIVQYNDDTLTTMLNNGNCTGNCNTFTTGNNFSSGLNTLEAISTADLNGDGTPDLIVTDNQVDGSHGQVAVLLGNGNGSFASAVGYLTPLSPLSLAIADFNGDGKLDVATADNAATGGKYYVSVLLGNGNGTLQGSINTEVTPTVPYALVAGDFNRDGKPDLAVLDQAAKSVLILTGNGNGTFASGASYGVGTSAQAIVTGDFNRDGKLDLAITNSGDNTVSILTGNGDGTFATLTPFTRSGFNAPSAIAAGDFNRDGIPDLVLVENFGSHAWIATGNGDGTFSIGPTISLGFNVVNVSVADFNRDGKLDLGFSDAGAANGAGIAYGNGDGTFVTSTFYPAGNFVAPMTAADFNGDGKIDMAVLNSGSDRTTTIVLNTCTVSPTFSKVFGAPSIPMGGTTTLTFQMSNPNASGLTGIGFTDTLPSQLVVGTPIGLTGNCDGIIDATTGGTSITLSGATLAASANCSFTVNVTSIAGGIANNLTDDITSNEGGPWQDAAASLTIIGPPVLSKNFGGLTVPLNGTTSLTFGITNPNTTTTLTGIGFSDPFPAGLAAGMVTGTCGGGMITVNTNTVALSGATLMPSAQCMFSVDVTGTMVGMRVNTTGPISAAESGAGTSAAASIFVVAPPTISESFGAATMPQGGKVDLSFTLNNPDPTVPLTGVQFSDTLAAGMVVTPGGGSVTGTCGGGTIMASGSAISLSGATLPASGGCTFSVSLTSTQAGNYNNTSGNVSSNEGGQGLTASSSVNVIGSPLIAKSFSPTSIPNGGTTTLSFTLSNPNSSDTLNAVGFTDQLPSGLLVAAPNGLTGTCGGGAITARPGSNSVSLSGASLAPSAMCTFSVSVTSTTVGAKHNVARSSSTEGGHAASGSFDLTVNAAAATSNCGKFVTRTHNVGSNPIAMASGDFNGDGHNDLAVVSFNSQNVSILLGNGDGTFGDGQTYATGGGPKSIAVGDFNGDGKLDLVVVNEFSVSVSFFKGNGDGTFAAGVEYPAGDEPRSVVVADVNGDGKPDLAVTDVFDHTVLILLGTGNDVGTFTAATPFPVNNFPTSIAAGDFNGDGIVDFAVPTSGTNAVAILLGNGDGTLAAPVTVPVEAQPIAVATGDFNSDGKADLVVTLTNAFPSPTVSVFLGNGDGTFQSVLDSYGGDYPQAVAAGDFTGDGKLDLALPNGISGNSVTVVAGNGDGTFAPGTAYGAGVAVAAVLADFDDDGKLDVAGLSDTNFVSVLVNVCGPTLTKAFGGPTLLLPGTTSLTFNVGNPNKTPLTGVAFSDSLPAGMQIASSPAVTGNCGGSIFATPGQSLVSVSSVSLAAHAACSVSLNVTATTGGQKDNVTSLIGSNESPPGGSASASITILLPANPTGTIATAQTTTSVLVTWIGSATGTSYEIARSSPTNYMAFTTIGTTSSSSFTDNTAQANNAYLYKVRAVAPSTSPYTAPDLALTMMFTDPLLTPGTTIKAQHIVDLRTAINYVRILAGVGTFSFTDPALAAGTPIKRIHVIDLRTALDFARSTMSLPAIVYTQPTITAGSTVMRAADINDLRSGVQ